MKEEKKRKEKPVPNTAKIVNPGRANDIKARQESDKFLRKSPVLLPGPRIITDKNIEVKARFSADRFSKTSINNNIATKVKAKHDRSVAIIKREGLLCIKAKSSDNFLIVSFRD